MVQKNKTIGKNTKDRKKNGIDYVLRGYIYRLAR